MNLELNAVLSLGFNFDIHHFPPFLPNRIAIPRETRPRNLPLGIILLFCQSSNSCFLISLVIHNCL